MTAQIGERLIYEGEEVWMTSYPGLPLDDPRLVRRNLQELQAAGEVPPSVFSTACWRQYLGTWELRGGRLYLNRVEGTYRLEGDGPLFAGWFDGVLRVPRGKVLQYVHMGYESVYEEELCLRVEGGVLTKTWTVDNRGKAPPQGPEPPRPPAGWWRKLFGGKGS